MLDTEFSALQALWVIACVLGIFDLVIIYALQSRRLLFWLFLHEKVSDLLSALEAEFAKIDRLDDVR